MAKIYMLALFQRMIEFHATAKLKKHQRKAVTLQAYANKKNVLSDYLSENKNLKLKAIRFSEDVANDYYTWLLHKYKNNYAIRCVEIVVTTLKFGVKQGLIPYTPITELDFQRTKADKPTYFTPDEINKWENYNTDDEWKQKAGHLAVLQIHTGFDYGDFKEVRREHKLFIKGRKFIIKGRQKNDNEAIIPLTTQAENILEFYNYNMDLMVNSKYNELIKEISITLGTKYDLKCKDLRKVFFMNQLNNLGMSLEATSKMGGHKRIQTTEEFYGQVNVNLILNQLSERGL